MWDKSSWCQISSLVSGSNRPLQSFVSCRSLSSICWFVNLPNAIMLLSRSSWICLHCSNSSGRASSKVGHYCIFVNFQHQPKWRHLKTNRQFINKIYFKLEYIKIKLCLLSAFPCLNLLAIHIHLPNPNCHLRSRLQCYECCLPSWTNHYVSSLRNSQMNEIM